jgi:hypothetical protein
VSYDRHFITMRYITTKQDLTFFIVKPLLLNDLQSVVLLTSSLLQKFSQFSKIDIGTKTNLALQELMLNQLG